MPAPGWYNDNENRKFPFLETSDAMVAGIEIPKTAFLDAGFILGIRTDADPGTRIWLYSVNVETVQLTDEEPSSAVPAVPSAPASSSSSSSSSVAASSIAPVFVQLVTMKFRMELDGATHEFVFVRTADDPYGTTDFVDATSITTDEIDSEFGFAFLVMGNMSDLVAAFPEGTEYVETGVSKSQVEPALVKSSKLAHVRRVHIANDLGPVFVPCGSGPAGPEPGGDCVEPTASAEEFLGDVKLKPGYNALIKVVEADNRIELSSSVGAGEGEPCSEISRTPGVSTSSQLKNLIICVPDGAGTEHYKAASFFKAGIDGALNFQSFPVVDLVGTNTASGGVTDSAAGSTAIATGRRVDLFVVSQALPGGGEDLETLLEVFKGLGRSTGLVTTAPVADAEPAAFGAHTATRFDTAGIVSDYLNSSRPDVLFGGSSDGLDSATGTAAGYTVVTSKSGLITLPSDPGPVMGFFAPGLFPYVLDGYPVTVPTLAEMADKAIEILSQNEDGFFLLLENENVDEATHLNDIDRMIPEVLNFEEAVQVAIDFAAGRDDTLVIVVADHEGGGLTVTSNNGVGVIPDVTWSTTGHTDTPVACYASGVGESNFGQMAHLTDVNLGALRALRQVQAAGETCLGLVYTINGIPPVSSGNFQLTGGTGVDIVIGSEPNTLEVSVDEGVFLGGCE